MSKRLCLYSLLIFNLFFAATSSQGRSVFVNGIDVSSSFNQDMKGVDVKIDDKGNIFITAPHYQVKEEDTFFPLVPPTPPTPQAPQPAPVPKAVPASTPLPSSASKPSQEPVKENKQAPKEESEATQAVPSPAKEPVIEPKSPASAEEPKAP